MNKGTLLGNNIILLTHEAIYNESRREDAAAINSSLYYLNIYLTLQLFHISLLRYFQVNYAKVPMTYVNKRQGKTT